MELNRTPERLRVPFVRADDGDIIEFEQRGALGYIQLHGIVTDVARDERHYSGLHKFSRSLLYGEPYQLRKTGRSDYGATASYTTLRLEPLEQTGLAREILCFGEMNSRLACGDEVMLQVRQVRGRYHFVCGKNLTLGNRIQGDLFCVNFWMLLAPALLLTVSVISMLPQLMQLFSGLASSLITLAAIGFVLHITLFRDIIRFFCRR